MNQTEPKSRPIRGPLEPRALRRLSTSAVVNEPAAEMQDLACALELTTKIGNEVTFRAQRRVRRDRL